jgi:hypothetical protein
MRKPFGAIHSSILVVGLFLTAACGGTPPVSGAPVSVATPAPVSTTGAQQVTVRVVNGIQFEPSSIVVRVSQPIGLALRNEAR